MNSGFLNERRTMYRIILNTSSWLILMILTQVSCRYAGNYVQNTTQSCPSLSDFQEAKWGTLVGTEPIQLGPYTIYQEFNKKTYERRVYLKRKDEPIPKYVYSHHRAISVVLGNVHNRLLINDFFATKANKVIVVDIESAKHWQIDQQVMRTYKEDVNPDPRLDLLPIGKAFSPNDNKVLLNVILHYVVASTPEEASEASKSYRIRWYVVSAADGEIIKEYQSNAIPEVWW